LRAPEGWRRAALLLLWPAVAGVASAQTVPLATSDFPPFAGEQLPEQGFYVALVKAAWREAGLQPQVQFLPWARGQALAQSGEVFGIFPYLPTPEREAAYRFSAPLYQVQARVFVTADSQWQWQQPSELRGRTLCRQRASAVPAPVQALIDSGALKLEETSSLAACLQMLQLHRADLVVINAANGWHTVQQAFGHRNGFKTLGPPVATVTHHLMVGRQHPQAEAWLQRFDEALARLRQRGEIRTLEQRLMPVLP
jgi:polar amino acid transport system substrate-binding protein